MAALQIQRAAKSQTVTQTAIDQKQSLELVQTMLHGSLSTLCFLRFATLHALSRMQDPADNHSNFFVEDAFEKQIFSKSNRNIPYEDFATGKPDKSEDGDDGVPCIGMRVLRRGRSKRVDMFLDWLEKGAFVALRAGTLRGLQVYVHADPTDRTKVIETYTFSIRYSKDVNNVSIVAGLEVEGTGTSFVSGAEVNTGLWDIFDAVVTLCKGMPDLPDQRFISMALFYAGNTIKEHKPSGFVPSTTDELAFAQFSGWERANSVMPAVESPYHRSSMRISYLHKSPTTAIPCRGRPLALTELPHGLTYSTPDSKHAEIEATDAICEQPFNTKKQLAEETRVAATPSTVIDDGDEMELALEVKPEQKRTSTALFALPSNTGPSGESARGKLNHGKYIDDNAIAAPQSQLCETQISQLHNTQSSNTTNMRRAFRNMMQPERITQGDTQMQVHSRTESIATLSQTNASPESSMNALRSLHGKPSLPSTKVEALIRSKPQLRQSAQEAGREAENGDVVSCQCQHSEAEGDMVQCVYCDTWQHLHCYGYTDRCDPRIPDEHVCYHCLLSDEKSPDMSRLQQLCQQRRAMFIATQYGLTTQKQFATDFVGPKHLAGPLFQQMKRDRYVTAAKHSTRTTQDGTSKSRFVPVRDGPDHDRMMRNLFDPLLRISHLYKPMSSLVTQPPGSTERTFTALLHEMPSPVTTASQLRKRNITTPIVSYSAGTAPHPTPSRQLRPSKRLRDETIRESPNSTKRFKSLQSEYVLDAGGLPSSPFGMGMPSIR